MIRTHQKTSKVLPQRKNRNLGLMIACGNCATARVFKIDEMIRALEKRETAGHIIETKCEECGHLIGVAIGWINASKLGYSYCKMEFSPKQNIMITSDESGLCKVNQKRG